MSNVYLNQNVRFKCQNGQAVYFKPQAGSSSVRMNGADALLDDCSLCLVGPPHPGQCSLVPDPSTGAPGPCVFSSAGRKNSTNTVISGKHILNSGCSFQCLMGGTIKPFKPTFSAINVDDAVSNITVQITISDTTNSPSPSTNQSGENSGKIYGDEAGKPERQQMAERAVESPSAAREGASAHNTIAAGDVEYALCDYKNCARADSCAYLETSPCLAETDESKNAAILRNNIGRDAFDRYAADCSAIAAALLGRESYSIAHHHIIPVNQCFKQYPELVKLANYYRYDINNALNGICLPTMNQGYDKQPLQQRLQIAFTAMEKLGKQWHKGPHKYEKALSRQIDDLLIGQKPIKDYKTSVDEYLEQLRSRLIFESKCRAENFDSEAESFCKAMNHISEKIANKLRKFETNPRQSYSFFVSKIALYYAYYEELKDYQNLFFEGE